jgi:hypothetical protein
MGPALTSIAYAAGIIDGEGSISASVSPRCAKNFRIHVAVGMCDREVPDFLAQVFGGKVRLEKRKTGAGKSVFTWTIYCRNAAEFLALVLPYLRVKRDRAEDAILLASMMRNRVEVMRTPFGEGEIAARMEIASRIKAANIASNGRLANHAS